MSCSDNASSRATALRTAADTFVRAARIDSAGSTPLSARLPSEVAVTGAGGPPFRPGSGGAGFDPEPKTPMVLRLAIVVGDEGRFFLRPPTRIDHDLEHRFTLVYGRSNRDDVVSRLPLTFGANRMQGA